MNATMLQKIKARLTLLNAKQSLAVADGSYSVYSIEGSESLGSPYVYEISFVSPAKLEVEELVDTDITLVLQDEKEFTLKREIFAKVYSAKAKDKVGDKYLYTLTAVHPLYYLGLNQRYEIFQEKSAYEIMQELLGRYKALLHIEFQSNIPPHTFIKREYTTQYKQSDLEFIQMLCEQEGVTLWMQSDTSPYVVRVAHINESYTKWNSALTCNFTQSKTFSPTNVIEDYYDFNKPSFEYKSTTGQTPLSQSLKDNKHTSQLRHDLEVMTHRDRLEDPRAKDLKNDIKQSALKQYSNSEEINGKSLSLHTQTGYGGELFDSKAVKRTNVVLTEVKIQAQFPNALDEYVQNETNVQQYIFEAEFKATPIQTVFIPNYNIIKPLIPSSVTALVSDGSEVTTVPSKNNTIDVDSKGRIGVIFHFDNKYPTSCYIRFTNFSAGDGWGSQFIPRVNTEVIVNFLNGDPDRPVAIGSLYNANNNIPKDLPSKKTQSYIKTQSMPGTNEEYNLLLFEDKQAQELVHIRAQKDYKLHALNNLYINIDNDQTEVVGHDESFTIGNDRTKSIGNDESTDVGHDRAESVGNDESISIGNDQTLTVGHDQSNHIQNTQANKIDKDQITYVGNHRQDDIYANHTVKVGGHFEHTVNGKVDLKAGEKINSVTTLYQIDAEKFTAKGPGGTIILDGGITFKGDVTIKGNVAISSGSAEGVASFSARANTGEAICWNCLLKEIEDAQNAS